MSTSSSDREIEPGPDATERALGRAETCLSFTLAGPWAHFRRIEGNIVKQTYRIVPRTTVAGVLAAVLGIGRDDYYDLFAPSRSLVAIQPVAQLRTMNLPMNTLSTASGDMKSLNPHGKISVRFPDPTKARQQHNYEVLVDPAYRIDVWIDDDDRYTELRERLGRGDSHYVPSLGLSEHLATVEYHGEFDIEPGPKGVAEIDSAVPDASEHVLPSAETRHRLEQSPAFMTADETGRTTTGFVSYAYDPTPGSLSVETDETTGAWVVDDRTVMFV